MVIRTCIIFICFGWLVYGADRFATAYRPDIDLTEKPVEFVLDDDRLNVDISRPIYPFSRLKIRITPEVFKNYEIDSVFNMRMDMGKFETKFLQKDSYYEGEIILPKCIWGDKRWYMKLVIKKEGAVSYKVLLFDMMK